MGVTPVVLRNVAVNELVLLKPMVRPISVTETFEPNGEGSPEPVSPTSLYLSYVTTADDLDFYSLPAPPIGSGRSDQEAPRQ